MHRVDVRVRNARRWTCNACEYPTVEEADQAARDLAGNWSRVSAYRIVPVDHPRRERVDYGACQDQHLIVLGW